MKKSFLILCLTAISITKPYSTADLPTRGCLTQSVWDIKDCFEGVIDELNNLTGCAKPVLITADDLKDGYVIDEPGYYCLTQDFVAPPGFAKNPITIQGTQNVVLDLHGHEIDMTAAAKPDFPDFITAVYINTSTHVTVVNGKVKMTKDFDPSGGPIIGISVGFGLLNVAGVNHLQIADVVLQGGRIGLGLFLCNDTHISGCSFDNQRDGIIAALSDGGTIEQCTINNSSANAVFLASCSDYTLRNLQIDGAKNIGIVLETSINGIIDAVQMTNVATGIAFGANAGPSLNNQIINSSIEYTDNGINAFEGPLNVTIQNCQFKGVGDDAQQAIAIQGTDFTIDGCEILLTATQTAAILFQGGGNTLIKNTIISGGKNGIEVTGESHNTVIDNCLIKDADSTGAEILLTSSANNTTIRNCQLQGGAAGIAAADSNSISILNCSVEGAGQAGIAFGLPTGGPIDGFTIQDTLVQNNNNFGLFGEMNNGTVKRSQFVNNSDGGVQVLGRNITLADCIASHNFTGFNTTTNSTAINLINCQALNNLGSGFGISSSSQVIINNCVATGNARGIFLGVATSCAVLNSVASNNKGDGIFLDNITTNCQVHHNKVFGNGVVGINNVNSLNNNFYGNFMNNNLVNNYVGVSDIGNNFASNVAN